MRSLLGLLLSALLLLGGCPRHKKINNAGETKTDAPEVTARASKARADRLFSRRDDPKDLQSAISNYEKALKDPTDVESRAKLARAYELSMRDPKNQTGDGKLLAERVYAKGVGVAAEALEIKAPGITKNGALSVGDLKRLDASSAEALYSYTLLLWRWCVAQGRATELSRAKELLGAADRLIELDPGLLGAAPYRLRAEIYAELPSFAEGDFEKAKADFEQAKNLSPSSLENLASYARACEAEGDQGQARLLWEQVRDGDPDRPAELSAENRIEQRWANEVLK